MRNSRYKFKSFIGRLRGRGRWACRSWARGSCLVGTCSTFIVDRRSSKVCRRGMSRRRIIVVVVAGSEHSASHSYSSHTQAPPHTIYSNTPPPSPPPPSPPSPSA